VTKAGLRKLYKEKRKQLSWKERNLLQDLILINFQKLDLPFINCVHTYLAIENQNEVDTKNITLYLAFKNPGLKIAVPKINLNAAEMKHYILDDDIKLAPNAFGIIEPVNGQEVSAADIDLVITPLLAFTKSGNRVGYGKGFYDKFFSECKTNVIKIGLSFFDAEEDIFDKNDHDIALDYCITPHLIYTF